MARPRRLLITCEHAGRRVPARYAPLFAPHRAILETHRGYDPGALPLARALAKALDAPLVAHHLTRLLADVNRSPHNPAVFSEITRTLPASELRAILAKYHTPHREAVRTLAKELIAGGAQVIHIGVHSFTPKLRGRVRNAELGLLYDPARPPEKRLCAAWCNAMREAWPGARVRMNYPYRGASDGLTTTLRRAFSARDYLGIELEVNQALLDARGRFPAALTPALTQTLRATLTAS